LGGLGGDVDSGVAGVLGSAEGVAAVALVDQLRVVHGRELGESVTPGRQREIAHRPNSAGLKVNRDDLDGGEGDVVPQHVHDLAAVAVERRMKLERCRLRGQQFPGGARGQRFPCTRERA
jgi:hypothetical protein